MLCKLSLKQLYVLEAPRPMGGSFPPWSTTQCAKLAGLAESVGKEDPTT